MSGSSTRAQIVEVADRLFYEQGYEHTSFADIASEVKISRGNFYHHFKTKDAILSAVIEHRLAKTAQLLRQWEREGETAEERIRHFIDILIMNMAKIKRFGCPVGTLCSELAKLDHASQEDATRLFSLFREWLGGQFAELGSPADADDLAMYLLARSQGVATLASAFGDEAFIEQEVTAMHGWLRQQAERAAS